MSAEPVLASAAAERLRVLVEVAKTLGEAAADEHRLAALLTTHVADLVGDAVSLWLLPVGGAELSCVSCAHPDPAGQLLLEEIHRDRARFGPSALGQRSLEAEGQMVLNGSELIGSELVGSDQLGPAYQPWVDRYGISSLALLPMRTRGRTVGLLGATRDRDRPPYDDDDIHFMQALADIAAITLDNNHLLADSAAAHEELRRQSELVDQISDVIVAVDAEHRIVNWNAAAERVYLYLREDALGCDLYALLATQFFTSGGETLTREEVLGQLREQGGWQGELRERRADGNEVETLTSLTALTDAEGHYTGLVSLNRDVTEQRRKEHLAMHDVLTGLPNRRLLSEHLRRALAQAKRNGTTLAVFFLDLDGFKEVNDSLGHQAGDEVLRMTARRLSAALRANDTVARFGGDEFVVLAEDVGNKDGAAYVARRLISSVSESIAFAGRTVSVLPSIGVALASGGEQPEDLVRASDQAMYMAKQHRWGVAFAS